jgi:putative hydrolase of the HAD superfamily
MPPQVVLFDLGGVLIDFDFERALIKAEKISRIPRAEIRRRIFQDEWPAMTEFECGRLSLPDFNARWEAVLETKIEPAVLHELWMNIFTGELGPMVGLLRGLIDSDRARTAVLSNTNELHLRHLWRHWPRLKEPEAIYASNEIGRRKPERECYEFVTRSLNVRPADVVFLDDMEWNVTGAREAGLRAIHVTSREVVLDGLSEMGFDRDALERWMSPPFPPDLYELRDPTASPPTFRGRTSY